MQPLLAIRYSLAALIASVGCFLILSGFAEGRLCFYLVVFLSMSRSEFTTPLPRRHIWLIFGSLAALVGVGYACKHFIPFSASETVQRFARHPAFVVLFWLGMLFAIFRNYQRQKEKTAGAD